MDRRRVLAVVSLVLLVGCGGSQTAASPPGPTPAATVEGRASPATTVSSPAIAPPSPTASTDAAEAPPPSAAPAGSVVLAYGPSDAQTVLVAPSGRHVFIDISNPAALPFPPTANDVLVTTHRHDDHYVQAFLDAFPGKTLTWTAGTATLDDVTVTAIPGEHHADPLQSIPNFIVIVEVAGVRVVHFGDLGQDSLTPAQRKAIGTPDVLLAQLSNSFSDMTATNRRAVTLIDQAHPRLLIPTHMIDDTVETAKMGAAAWPATWTPKSWITLRPGMLSADTTLLFMGGSAKAYGKITNAPESSL